MAVLVSTVSYTEVSVLSLSAPGLVRKTRIIASIIRIGETWNHVVRSNVSLKETALFEFSKLTQTKFISHDLAPIK